jgi:excisionase family DNA binding protein
VEVAADLVGCHPETIRRAIRTRELLATRHPTAKGRPFRIDQTDLEDFLRKRRLA